MKSELCQIPGVGPKMASYLEQQGIYTLYVWRLAVYYAENKEKDPEKLKWWYWKDHPYPER